MEIGQKKIKVGVLFGGKSAEHEISLQSAKNVYDALDRSKFDPVLIGIDKYGNWFLNNDSHSVSLSPSSEPVAIVPESLGSLLVYDSLSNTAAPPYGEVAPPLPFPKLDVVFPILHGPFGEDGTVQGLLKLAGVPFVGSGVLGSAVGMDKDVMKRLFRDAGIPIGKFLSYKSHEPLPSFAEVTAILGSPVFVKPANMGSSVGIGKAHDEAEFSGAVRGAFCYDTKIVVEEFIQGREIECAVLGDENPIASIPGEVIPTHEFYSYEAKYLDTHGAALVIPAKLDKEKQQHIQEIAVKAFQTLCCEGLARLDFFLREDGKVMINEINTIPGFTKFSMYPKLWEASGIGYTELISRLIEMAIKRFEKEKNLKVSYV
jgi:D-alanine-D-alanine ligase